MSEALRPAVVLRWLIGVAMLAGLMVILSGQVPALDPVIVFMDRVGVEIGRYRLSLLSGARLLVTVVGLFVAVRLIHRILRRYIRRAERLDPAQRLLAEKLVGIALVVAAFFFGIDLLGIDLTALAVFSGALGLAVGFGLQKTFGNLIAGIILLMDRSIKPGDVIVVGDSFGWVNKIGIRAVSVITRDGKEHLIPNENLMTQEVENWSFSDRNVRLHIPVVIAYGTDPVLAEELMMRAAREAPRVLDAPPTNVWMTKLGENGIEYDILVWIADPERGVGSVKSDVLRCLWRLFREHGIRVPHPQREIRLKPDSSE